MVVWLTTLASRRWIRLSAQELYGAAAFLPNVESADAAQR